MSYAKAVELALNSETATQSVKELRGKQEGGSTPQPVYKTNSVTPASGENADFVPTCYRCGNSPPIIVKVRVDDCLISIEVDTGAAHSLISEKTFESLWPGRSLNPTTIRLQSYSKEPIPVKGCCYVNVEYEGQTGEMPLLIVGGSGPTLLGRLAESS